MKRQLRIFALLVAMLLALSVGTLGAVAASRLHRAGGAPLAFGSFAPAAACTKMTASDVIWVTLDADDEPDEQVESYDSGTNLITPLFEYNCIPKKTTLVTVFTFEGEAVYNDKESLKSSNSEGFYYYPLGTTDESPLDEGTWGVEFYVGKKLLTSGEVTIGGGGDFSDTVTVYGVVTDAKTKKPIKGAIILVLVPDVTVQDFVDGGQADEDIFTAAKSDSKGGYELESPLERNVEYSIIVVAKGYKPIGQDGLVIGDEEEDPLEIDISLSK